MKQTKRNLIVIALTAAFSAASLFASVAPVSVGGAVPDPTPSPRKIGRVPAPTPSPVTVRRGTTPAKTAPNRNSSTRRKSTTRRPAKYANQETSYRKRKPRR